MLLNLLSGYFIAENLNNSHFLDFQSKKEFILQTHSMENNRVHNAFQNLTNIKNNIKFNSSCVFNESFFNFQRYYHTQTAAILVQGKTRKFTIKKVKENS